MLSPGSEASATALALWFERDSFSSKERANLKASILLTQVYKSIGIESS